MKGRAVVISLIGLGLLGLLGVGAPAQKSIVPDWLAQKARAWQVLAPTGQVPVETVILWCVQTPTSEQLEQLKAAGYTVVGVSGNMVTVSAPVTLYLDEQKGLDSMGFFGFVLPTLHLTSFNSRAKSTYPIWFAPGFYCY